VALIVIGGRSRENLIAVAHSANDLLAAADVEAASRLFAGADAVLCQLEVPLAAVEATARLAAQHRVPFVLNPAPAKKIPARLLRMVHTLTPNETEAAVLTGSSDPATAARILQKRGCARVVVTIGPRGAWVCSEEWEGLIPAPRVKPVDTVGAGDCFSAWLALGIAEGISIQSAVERAVRAASISVTRHGSQSGMPCRAEL
jgi:ribokinase